MVARLVEERPGVDGGVPVDLAEHDRGGWLQLADDLLEVVAAVTVEDHELAYAMRFERGDQVAKDRLLGGRVEVEAERDVELPGLHTEGHGGQHHDPRAAIPRGLGDNGREAFRLD